VLLVAYPGHAIVWFARLIATAPVVFDALASFYEAEVLSRRPDKRCSLFAFRMWFIDFIACHTAHRTLVETTAQVMYFKKLFFISTTRCRRLFTGADETAFRFNPEIYKYEQFTVVFRGRFLPEAGARHVLGAARILKEEPIEFRIYGQGLLEAEIKKELDSSPGVKVVLDTKIYPLEDLPVLMQPCHVSLGQLERHERLERTIPHKAFESLALRLPYVTARYPAIAELVTDGESALFFDPGNAEDLARQILALYKDASLRERIAQNGYNAYHEHAGRDVLGRELISILQELTS
jgi:glycosyltransferase involved in cell wall biosynthesis